MSTMVEDWGDLIAYAAEEPKYVEGFQDCLDGIVDFLNRNLDDHPDKLVETLTNLSAVLKEHT